MIKYKNNKWVFVEDYIKYKRNNKEIKQPVIEGREWWEEFEEMHKGKPTGIEILEFIPVTPTPEQIDRLNKINQLGIREGFNFSEYVETGRLPDEADNKNHPLYQIYIEEIFNIYENDVELINDDIANLFMDVVDSEIDRQILADTDAELMMDMIDLEVKLMDKGVI